MNKAGIARDYRASTPLAEIQIYRGEDADLLILINHSRGTEVVLRIPRGIESLELLGTMQKPSASHQERQG
ncbi:MAG: hypothetical protein DRO13_02665 [Thermoprotei archaeon]|nr:MAG: hypothetical protein DRO13_02665 [Thermoprotei archaeon]